MNESELVALLKTKDRQAFKELVETWQDMVYNTSIGFLQNEEDAEDISQEVFIKVYQSMYSFKGQSKLSTWIYRITVSKCLDHLRKKKRKKRFAFMQGLYGNNDNLAIDPPDFIHPGVKTESKEKSITLFKAIDKLPANQKTAFVLNKVEELSYREISEIMDSSESAVDSLLQRAKKNLQILLKDALA
ncbi:MAG: RNA polymerase sigma factor [Ginsengibacter sp.]